MKINPYNSPIFAQTKWDAFVASYTGPYDFSESVYAGMNRKVTFRCPEHGYVTSDAKNLMNGKLCFKCAVANRKPRITHESAIDRFKAVHGARYDYTKVQYEKQNKPVEITCSKHGAFMQQPEFHWNGAGCPQCFHEDRRGAGQRHTAETFKEKVYGIFGDLFAFPNLTYTNNHTEIQVVCTKHSTINTSKPGWLINGQNPCPRCNHMKSAPEQAIASFLKIFTTVVQRDRTVIAPKELDILLPDNHLAVEFCGMYWHSHFDADAEAKNKHSHYNKYAASKAQNIRLLTIYETEWEERQPQIKRLLRNAIGKTKGKLMARKCGLQMVSAADARKFYDRYHPQGGEGSGEHYGLYWKGKLVACMRFSFGANDRGHSERTWTLARYATRINVAGAASRLFKAFVVDKQPNTVKSFSDNRYFSGGMYEQLGFTLEADIAPDYQVWSPKIGLRPKPHYQRRNIPKRLQEHGSVSEFDPATDARTEREMTYLMGCGRIYDCGKKRWVWTG